MFLPSVPTLLGFAAELEAQRDHVLGRRITDEDDIFAAERDLLAAAERGEGASDELALPGYQALGSEARFDHVLYDGATFGHAGDVHVGSEEEMDFLGIPGLLEPDQVRELLHHRQKERRRPPDRRRSPTPVEQVTTHEQLAVLRRELNGLVAAWHHRTGQAHGPTHAALRKDCGGPAAAIANADQLRARIDRVREWAAAAVTLLTEPRLRPTSLESRHGGRDVPDAGSRDPGADGARGCAARALRHGAGRDAGDQPHGRLPARQHARAARAGAPRRPGPAARRARRAARRDRGPAGVRDVAIPVLRQLAERVGCTAHLTVAEGDEALALAVIEPSWTDFHVSYRVGARHPLNRGAAGKAILLLRDAASHAVRRDGR